ncbi:MAG: DUF2325 domain-containing protein [Helicobacteraceae bacterium]|jgi:hypothetical protein|nr:DUF2325 domain-containing protein [Helicobacteraceae bacterium]
MSVLVIGGDRVDSIKEVLYSRGADEVTHWDMRKARDCDRKLPECADCVVMMIDYLSHNAMSHFKKEAKKNGVPVICAKRGSASISCALDQVGFSGGKVAGACQRHCAAIGKV